MLCYFGLLSMCLMKVRRGELIQSFREAVGDAQLSCHPASGGWGRQRRRGLRYPSRPLGGRGPLL